MKECKINVKTAQKVKGWWARDSLRVKMLAANWKPELGPRNAMVEETDSYKHLQNATQTP